MGATAATVFPDGKKFLTNAITTEETPAPLSLVLNSSVGPVLYCATPRIASKNLHPFSDRFTVVLNCTVTLLAICPRAEIGAPGPVIAVLSSVVRSVNV